MAAAAKVVTEKKEVEKEVIEKKEVEKEVIEKKEVEKEVITAVYRVNLHCQQCARDIKKPLLSQQGVHSVEADFEKSEIRVKGVIDVIKIHKLIEKLSKKKVELISPKINLTEKKEKVVVKAEAKPPPKISTHTVKVHLHCDKCEKDLRKKLLKHKSIYSVKSDMKAQTITVEGIMEGDKLVAYLRKKVHKSAVLIKSEKKEEKKEQPKKEEKKEQPKNEEKKEQPKVEVKPKEKTETVELNVEKKVEVKTKEGDSPYFIHYVYAPQLFSDENPNACFIM